MNGTKVILRTREISLAAGLLALFVIGVAPIAWMVGTIVVSAKPSDLLSLIITARQWHLLANTLVLGLLVAILTTLLGTSLGFILAKSDIPFKRILYPALMVPLFFPPYLLALASFYLLGRKGLVASLIGQGFGELGSSFLFSLSGNVYVLTSAYYPVTMIMVYTFVKAIDSSR
jgi:iron(III) transport system permease protein